MKYKTLFNYIQRLLTLVLILGVQSCTSSAGPKPIRYGKDQCVYCKMTISDPRFGTQLITKKGRVYNFDDVQCMIAFVKEGQIKKEEVSAFYLPDYISNKLMPAESLFYLKSAELKSPMRGDIAAFTEQSTREESLKKVGGTKLSWEDLWK